ncbi:PREDICTED: uncharacterized protein LOC107328247 [Acropora digitifera]|uniref:uncharacterized protein LOC107328247 n=1 Tax=Acropora digitifera TaxID=70779 RepID=UPI00077A4A7F|nr:PREDICTED: uncharacterized protein LOC107328247 [Acropora digitifera]
MVKQGEKPHSKNGISIQNTRTLTQGQMKIRIFTGLASSLQSVQRKKAQNLSLSDFGKHGSKKHSSLAENESFTRIRRDPNGIKLPMPPSGKSCGHMPFHYMIY